MIEYENLGKLNKPFFEEFNKAFQDFIHSGWYVLGKSVEQFEEAFAQYNNVKYCIGVASGLDALILGLRTFDFEKDSEVIVPSNTYIATILAVINCGLKPVLVEPDIKTYNYSISEEIHSTTLSLPISYFHTKEDIERVIDVLNKASMQGI